MKRAILEVRKKITKGEFDDILNKLNNLSEEFFLASEKKKEERKNISMIQKVNPFSQKAKEYKNQKKREEIIKANYERLIAELKYRCSKKAANFLPFRLKYEVEALKKHINSIGTRRRFYSQDYGNVFKTVDITGRANINKSISNIERILAQEFGAAYQHAPKRATLVEYLVKEILEENGLKEQLK